MSTMSMENDTHIRTTFIRKLRRIDIWQFYDSFHGQLDGIIT
jgi:hypothetical protein